MFTKIINDLGFLFMSALMVVAMLGLSFFLFCLVVLVMLEIAVGPNTSGVLVIPVWLAVGTIAVYLVWLAIFLWIKRNEIRNEIASLFA